MKVTMLRKAMMALGIAVVSLPALLPLMAMSGRVGPRTIVLVARDMTFYAESDPATPNPSIVVVPDEEVTIVLRNEDAGITHDWSVRAWGVSVRPIDGKGRAEVRFRAPHTAGREQYACAPHARMMNGMIVVSADAARP